MDENILNEYVENTVKINEAACNIKAVAYNPDKNAILFEDNSGFEADGCNVNYLKEYFPDYNFDFYKNYFIQIDDEFYHGDTFEEIYWENKESVD
jgi:hypothetical protein